MNNKGIGNLTLMIICLVVASVMFLGLFTVYSDVGTTKYNMSVGEEYTSLHANFSEAINNSWGIADDAQTKLVSNSTTDTTSEIGLAYNAFGVLTFLPKSLLYINKLIFATARTLSIPIWAVYGAITIIVVIVLSTLLSALLRHEV